MTLLTQYTIKVVKLKERKSNFKTLIVAQKAQNTRFLKKTIELLINTKLTKFMKTIKKLAKKQSINIF